MPHRFNNNLHIFTRCSLLKQIRNTHLRVNIICWLYTAPEAVSINPLCDLFFTFHQPSASPWSDPLIIKPCKDRLAWCWCKVASHLQGEGHSRTHTRLVSRHLLCCWGVVWAWPVADSERYVAEDNCILIRRKGGGEGEVGLKWLIWDCTYKRAW